VTLALMIAMQWRVPGTPGWRAVSHDLDDDVGGICTSTMIWSARFGINCALCGHYGVPVAVITGG